jgi:hypothetical protein
MKTFTSFLFALASLTVTTVAQVSAPVGPHNIKLNKVQPAVLTTPEFSTDLPNKRFEKLKWLEVEVEFDVDKVELIDEITIKYFLLLNGKIYTGDVTHVNIPKGNNRYSVMYMSPRSIDRATGGKQLNQGMIENIWVQIEKQGVKLAEKSLVPKPMPPLPQTPGMLLPKGETPFQVLWWDRYEAVKPGSAR